MRKQVGYVVVETDRVRIHPESRVQRDDFGQRSRIPAFAEKNVAAVVHRQMRKFFAPRYLPDCIPSALRRELQFLAGRRRNAMCAVEVTLADRTPEQRLWQRSVAFGLRVREFRFYHPRWNEIRLHEFW